MRNILSCLYYKRNTFRNNITVSWSIFSGLMPTRPVEQCMAGITSPESACRFIIFSGFLLLTLNASPGQNLNFTQVNEYAQMGTVDEYQHTLLAHPSLLLSKEQQRGENCSFILVCGQGKSKEDAQKTMNPTCTAPWDHYSPMTSCLDHLAPKL